MNSSFFSRPLAPVLVVVVASALPASASVLWLLGLFLLRLLLRLFLRSLENGLLSDALQYIAKRGSARLLQAL